MAFHECCKPILSSFSILPLAIWYIDVIFLRKFIGWTFHPFHRQPQCCSDKLLQCSARSSSILFEKILRYFWCLFLAPVLTDTFSRYRRNLVWTGPNSLAAAHFDKHSLTTLQHFQKRDFTFFFCVFSLAFHPYHD